MKRLSGSAFTSVGIRPRYRGKPQITNDPFEGEQFEKELKVKNWAVRLRLAEIVVSFAIIILAAVLKIIAVHQSIVGQ